MNSKGISFKSLLLVLYFIFVHGTKIKFNFLFRIWNVGEGIDKTSIFLKEIIYLHFKQDFA